MPSVNNAVQELNDWRKLAFATALIERMAPNYQLFTELAEFGNRELYRNILNLVWESVAGQNSAIDFYKQLEKLQPIIPDPKDFDMYGVRPAFDACVGLEQLLNLCLSVDDGELASLLELSDSTIENYLEAVGKESGADEPLLLRQHEFAQQLLVYLSEFTSSRLDCVKSLRRLLQEDQSSNIGITVD